MKLSIPAVPVLFMKARRFMEGKYKLTFVNLHSSSEINVSGVMIADWFNVTVI